MAELPQIAQLRALGDEARAAEMAAYHKVARPYLGVTVPVIDALAKEWRADLDLPSRLGLAGELWQSDIHEARVAAAKLLTQARIRPDEAAWDLIAAWVRDFDSWAIADHVMKAGEKRLVADPSRLDQVEGWLDHPSFWVRRAALVGTLAWTHIRNPKPEDLARRERVLGWCARLAPDHQRFVQQAVGGWLRDLSRHDPQRVTDWLAEHGAALKPYARREAGRWLVKRAGDQPS